MAKISPLQTGRFYKVKSARKNFLCALCSTPRAMKYSKNLSFINYLQITIVAISLSVLLYPFIGVKAIIVALPVWIIFEVANKLLYRKEITCPYCGFDATWYRRDVNLAKHKVEDFWKTNYPELVNKLDNTTNESLAVAE